MKSLIVFFALIGAAFAARELQGIVPPPPLCGECGGSMNLGGFNTWIPQHSAWDGSNPWWDHGYIAGKCDALVTPWVANFATEYSNKGLGTLPGYVKGTFVNKCVDAWAHIIGNGNNQLYKEPWSVRKEYRDMFKCTLACLRKSLKKNLNINKSRWGSSYANIKENFGHRCLDFVRKYVPNSNKFGGNPAAAFDDVVDVVSCQCAYLNDYVKDKNNEPWVYPVTPLEQGMDPNNCPWIAVG